MNPQALKQTLSLTCLRYRTRCRKTELNLRKNTHAHTHIQRPSARARTLKVYPHQGPVSADGGEDNSPE